MKAWLEEKWLWLQDTIRGQGTIEIATLSINIAVFPLDWGLSKSKLERGYLFEIGPFVITVGW